MGLRTVFFLLLGVALAGIGGLTLITVTGPSEETTAAPVSEVLFARSRLPAGTIVEDDAVTWSRLPSDQEVPDGAVVRGETPRERVVGAAVETTIHADAPIPLSAIVGPDDDKFLATVLSSGARAMSVPARGSAATSGLIRPGDTVDVIVSWQTEEGMAAKTVLTRTRILAVGGRVTGTPQSDADSVTLEVTSAQAKRLAVAAETGRLTLNLRGQRDTDTGDVGADDVVTARDLLGVAAEPADERAAKAETDGSRDGGQTDVESGVSVRVITGGKSRTVTVPSDQQPQ